MNYKLLFRTLGRVLQLEALCILLPMVVAHRLPGGSPPLPLYHPAGRHPRHAAHPAPGKARLLPPGGVRRGGPELGGVEFVRRSAFWFSGEFASYTDCFFEVVSGFTTTGGSILTEVESLPHGILFWRSFASWIGGMGVLIFTLALPAQGGRADPGAGPGGVPGPVASKLVPKTAMSSRILYCIYIVFTAAETIALRIAGMPWFDAITTTLPRCAPAAAVRNLSIASYNLPACEIIITVFMLLCSLNFAVFFLVITGRLRQALAATS